MRRTSAIVGSALFFVVAPFLLAAVIPWWITRWEFRPAFFDVEPTRVIGVLLIVAGVPGIVGSFEGPQEAAQARPSVADGWVVRPLAARASQSRVVLRLRRGSHAQWKEVSHAQCPR